METTKTGKPVEIEDVVRKVQALLARQLHPNTGESESAACAEREEKHRLADREVVRAERRLIQLEENLDNAMVVFKREATWTNRCNLQDAMEKYRGEWNRLIMLKDAR